MTLRFINIDKVISFSLMSFVCFSFFSISLTQISCGVGGLAWMAKCYVTRSWGKQMFPLTVPFLLFVLACLVAVVGAVDFSGSYKSLKRLLEILIFFWAVNCIESEGQRDKLSLLLIASATLSTLTGFYTAWETGITIHSRAEGTMSVYMTYAGLLMLALLVASGKLIFAPKENKWLGPAIILMAVCLLLTFTRQAWLGVLAGVFFLIWFRKKSLLWFMPVVLGIILLISPADVRQRIDSLINLNDPNLQIRLALWQGGWLVFKDHPLTGCGFKCIDAVNQDYPDPTGYIKKLRGLHNNFIQLAVDMGLFGVVSWISIWVVYFMTLYRRLVSMPDNSTNRRDSMASAAAVVGFLVAGLFETNFYDAEVSMVLYFIMALPLTRGAIRNNSAS
ncbi:MAG TPA: O-antigen ligase family protein [Nitrospinae bacterium]|jgi:O-antigen ligase|nr:O-antigen ligase family protein [Nitrospinota bacterium]